MAKSIGTDFKTVSAELSDNANIETALEWLWDGDTINGTPVPGIEYHLSTLEGRINDITGDGGIFDGNNVPVTFLDTTFSIVNSSANKAKFAVTSATTYELPQTGINALLVTTEASQTLSQKTLVAPTVSSDIRLASGGIVFGDPLAYNGKIFYGRTTGFVANTPKQLDSSPAVKVRAGEYLISATAGSKQVATKIMFVHDGTNVDITEYATVTMGAAPSLLLTLTASLTGGNVVITAQMSEAGNISFVRTTVL